MSTRFVDHKNAHKLAKQTSDFVKRNYFSSTLWTTYGFIAFLVIGGLVAKWLLAKYMALSGIDLNVNIIIGLGVVVLLAAYMYFLVRRVTNIVQITEFQNMVFSSATKVNSIFCFIIDSGPKGQITYVDDLHHSTLRITQNDTLSAFLDTAEIKGEQRRKIEEAVAQRLRKELLVDIMSTANREEKIKLTIDPLDRPQGYTIIRGYRAVS